MQHYTVQDIMALRPCQPTEDEPDAGYPESKLRMLFGDRQSVTPLDICDDERVPIEDRQWVLHRLLPEQIVTEAACRYAEHALDREQVKGREPDPRSRAAIVAKRRWLRGGISNRRLEADKAAARTAADAVNTAAWNASKYAAKYAANAAWYASLDAYLAAANGAAECAAAAAAWAAVGRADWGATQAAERQWQLNTLREMIEATQDRNQQRKGKQ